MNAVDIDSNQRHVGYPAHPKGGGASEHTHLAIITTSEVIGGHEVQLAHLARKLASDQIVTVVVTEAVTQRFFADQGFNVRLAPFSEPGKIWRQWKNGRTLAKVLAPAIVDCDMAMVSGGTIEACVAPARALKLLRPRASVTAYIPMYIDRAVTHGPIGVLYNCTSRLLLGSIDRFITINRIQARLIGHRYQRPVTIIRNVIAPIARPSGDHGPRLVSIGRLDDGQKNVSGAIGLLDHPDNPFKVLHIFGDGPDRVALEARARLTKFITVVFHGWASHDTLARELGQRDVLIINSRWEGEPLIVRELRPAGIPTIGTDIPGLRGLLSRTSRYTDQSGLLAILKRRHAEVSAL